MAENRLLIVDDEQELIDGLARILELEFKNIKIHTANTGKQALQIAEKYKLDMVLTDMRMPEMDGIELLSKFSETDDSITTVMMTGHASIELAIAAVKKGAYDFICKPFDYQNVIKIITRGFERTRLLRENFKLREQVSESRGQSAFIGNCTLMQKFQEKLKTVAQTDYTVLVRGENGTGKELSARTIHELSKRKNGPIVMVNCPAIPENLLESELFGHKKGAFTGADKEKQGLFADADKGTICLDEIGDIPVSVQTKLLRVLQEGEIRPLGSNQTKKVDVRVIAMTNQNLEEKIENKSFRPDLFYRLNVITINNPSLTKISDDIPLIAVYFIKQTCRELQIPEKQISEEALKYLMTKAWPGNVRELQNIIKRTVIFCNDNKISRAHLLEQNESQHVTQDSYITDTPNYSNHTAYKSAKEEIIQQFSNKYISEVLVKSRGNVSQAAKESGLSRAAFQKIINKFSIDINQFRQ